METNRCVIYLTNEKKKTPRRNSISPTTLINYNFETHYIFHFLWCDCNVRLSKPPYTSFVHSDCDNRSRLIKRPMKKSHSLLFKRETTLKTSPPAPPTSSSSSEATRLNWKGKEHQHFFDGHNSWTLTLKCDRELKWTQNFPIFFNKSTAACLLYTIIQRSLALFNIWKLDLNWRKITAEKNDDKYEKRYMRPVSVTMHEIKKGFHADKLIKIWLTNEKWTTPHVCINLKSVQFELKLSRDLFDRKSQCSQFHVDYYKYRMNNELTWATNAMPNFRFLVPT